LHSVRKDAIYEYRLYTVERNKLIKLIWKKEGLPYQWKESIVVRIYKECDKTDCSNYRGISLLLTSYKILWNIILARLTPLQMKLLGITNVDFGVMDQRMIKFSISGGYWRKNGSITAEYITYL
jgi:hypothetical protein